MKVLVYDIAAESSGALTILKLYYEKAKKDIGNEYLFVVSTPKLEKCPNVQVINIPWIKKSWFHRLFFEYFDANKLVRKFGAEKILSLQNVTIPRTNVPQQLYLHQPIPFCEYKFSIFKNWKFWIYQNVISILINNSIKRADSIIVQTEWMKEACLKILKEDKKRILVEKPEVDMEITVDNSVIINDYPQFFYPATPFDYKNHTIIVKACKELVKKEKPAFKVVFTFNGNENRLAKKIKKYCSENKLPIEFTGTLSRQEVFAYYRKSILLFPSYIETLGLPLLEAKKMNAYIISADCPYSREVLEQYDNCKFFDPFDTEGLVEAMEEKIDKK